MKNFENVKQVKTWGLKLSWAKSRKLNHIISGLNPFFACVTQKDFDGQRRSNPHPEPEHGKGVLPSALVSC